MPDKWSESSSLKCEHRSSQEFLGGLFAPPYIPEDLNSDHWSVESLPHDRDVEGQLLQCVISLRKLDLKHESR